jgi:cell fate (sporulation/competence/biofilm development) regulator YlbF (YheA/YmcA/DUF963 family)
MASQHAESVNEIPSDEKGREDVTLLQAAGELAESIRESEEFRQYNEAVQQFTSDEEARQIFREYQKAQRVLQLSGRMSQGHNQAMAKAEELRREIEGNAVLTRFFLAQDSLVELLRSVDQELREKAGFGFAQFGKCAGGCH